VLLDNKSTCDWIWQNPASMYRAMSGDMAALSNNCIIKFSISNNRALVGPHWLRYYHCTRLASWCIMKKWNLMQMLVNTLAIIVWINNFQILKIWTVLCNFLWRKHDNKHVLIGVMRGGGCWAQYRSIELSTKTIESQRFNLGFYWIFLVVTAF